MKFNLEFDFEDLEFNEGSITEQLQSSIQNELVFKLKKEIDEKVMNAISAAVRTSIDTQLNEIIAQKIKSVIDSGVIKKQYGSDAITIEQYISDVFSKTEIKRSLEREIERDCEKYVKEMKKVYDMNFAAHIVKNMQANNLLNDDVANLLIKK